MLPKTCIMCEARAGAGEHTFPASMGGRRVNRGLYCNPHEKHLAPLIAALSTQLRFFHAMLKIRSDHKDAAEPFVFTMPSGKRVIAFDGSVKWADPDDEFCTDRIKIPNSFGGPGGLKVVAYIALNLFGQYFQSDVRKPGLNGIKEYLLNDTDNNFVWWERYETFALLPSNPFPFGHTIVLTTCSRTGAAQALISLFQSLNFGVDLGFAGGAQDKSVVVFINPQAESVPEGDVVATPYDSVIAQAHKPEPLYKHLKDMIESGGGQDGFQLFMNRVQRWKFDKDMAKNVETLNAARNLPAAEKFEVVKTFTEHQTARIYRIMQEVVKGLDNRYDVSEGDRKIMSRCFHKAIETDPEHQGRLTPYAQEIAISIMRVFIDRVADRLSHSDIDDQFLWEIYDSEYGLGLAGEAMRQPVMDMFVDVKTGKISL